MNRPVETITVTGGHTDEEYLASCPNNKPIPTILPPVGRIIAMGDIHGDFEVAVRMFRTAHLIDEQFRWIAQPPDTVVVQVGDQIDSCRPIPGRFSCDVPATRKEDNQADDLRVMRFFDEMHEKAQRAGGAVYSLLGNHELLNSKGVMTYVSYADGHQFRYQEDGVDYHGLEGRRKAFAPGGPLARSMGCSRTSVLVIGSTLFAHAGILPAISKYFDNSRMVDPDDRLRYINILVSKWLLGIVLPANEERILRLIRDGQNSPFWNRILGDIPYGEKINSPACASVRESLETYRIGSMVIGHTPQFIKNRDINGTCGVDDGRKEERRYAVYRVDGGYSKSFFAFTHHVPSVSVLEILNDQTFRVISETPEDVLPGEVIDIYAR